MSDLMQFLCLLVRFRGYPNLNEYAAFPGMVPTWGDPHAVQRCCSSEHPAAGEATVGDDVQESVLEVGLVEVKDLLK